MTTDGNSVDAGARATSEVFARFIASQRDIADAPPERRYAHIVGILDLICNVIDRPLMAYMMRGQRLVYTSRQWRIQLGWAPRQLAEVAFWHFVHPDDVQSTRDFIAAPGRLDRLDAFENRYVTVLGAYRTILWDGMVTLDEGSGIAVGLAEAGELEDGGEAGATHAKRVASLVGA